MKIENLCINCMKEKNSPKEKCPFCGYDGKNEKEKTYMLKPFTVLRKKYLVGKVIDEQIDAIYYMGMDLDLETKVVIKEYYPGGYVKRDTGISTQILCSAIDSESLVEKGKKEFLDSARNLAAQNDPSQIIVKDCFEENNTAYIIMEKMLSHNKIDSSGYIPFQTPEKEKYSRNKTPLIIGLAAAVILTGAISAYAYIQTKDKAEDAKTVVSAEQKSEGQKNPEKTESKATEKKSGKDTPEKDSNSDNKKKTVQKLTATPTPTSTPTPKPTKKPKPEPEPEPKSEPEPKPESAEAQYITYYVVNCKQSITLRPQPDVSSGEICQIPLGAAVSYMSSAENGFYKVTYNGNTGYALASYLSTEKQAAPSAEQYTAPSYETYYVVNCKQSITLRPQPDVSSGEICQIPLGAAVSYVSSAENGFYKVIYNGSTGYALASYLSREMQYTSEPQYTSYGETYYVVNCNESITLRTNPSTSAGEICQIPLGAAVSYISVAENGFYYICYNGNYGYSLASYLSPAYGEPAYNTCRVVNCNESITLREYPDTSAGEICQIPLGAIVSLESNAGNGFYEVYYMGQHGYALASYLAFE